MEFDSHITNSPSRITGTSALGLCASNRASDSTCSNGRSSSAQVHSTLRTLMEEVLPRTLSVMRGLLLQPFDFLDLPVDDGHHHGRGARAVFVHPGFDDRLAHLGVAAGVDIGRTHVFDAAVAPGRCPALLRQLGERGLVVDDPFAAAKGLGRRGKWEQRGERRNDGPEMHGAMLAPSGGPQDRLAYWRTHHCSSHGMPSPSPSIFAPGQLCRKNIASSHEVICEQYFRPSHW